MSDGAFVCRLNPFRHGLHGKALALPAKCPVRPASIPVVVASDGFKVFRKKKSAPKPVSSAPQRRAQPAHGKGGKLASPSTRELNGARKPHVDLGEAERLQKVMSRFGVASRRQSEVLITEGRVKVNGSVVKDLGVRVNSRKDKIQVNGQTLKMQVRAVWIAVHKPRGFVCDAREDERGTIFDLVPKAKQRNLAPVGRIDEDASGLVIMTNEKGHIAKLSAPTNNHIKEWVVDVEGIMEETAAQLLRKGVKLKDERRVTLPAVRQTVATWQCQIRVPSCANFLYLFYA